MTASAIGSYRFVDLSPEKRDAELLSRFYETLYVGEFPDPDERESLANMLHYLERRGEHGNDYIVTLLCDGDDIVGGSICDYFVRSNCGAIEFLTVKPSERGRGMASALARHVQQRMAAAAQTRGFSLAFVMAEMNDPFKRSRVTDNVEPFGRLRFWHQLGYRRTAFPYVQPALSLEQSPVTNLLLAAKPVDPALASSIPAARVIAFLRDYLIYAMRFDDPSSSPEFVTMCAYLERRPAISLVPFDTYVGDDPQRPFEVRAVEHAGHPDFAPAMELYRRAFSNPALAVGDGAFATLLAHGVEGGRYHLWALRARDGAHVRGMASFFALPSAGFGGYVAFEPPLLHAGRLRPLIARIERQFVSDGTVATGWYVESAGDAVAAFTHCGFTPLALDYRQPAGGPPLRLLYKEFGTPFAPPALAKTALRRALREIARGVYGIDPPGAVPAFAEIARSVDELPGDAVPFEVVAAR